jgi:hypothetical protein
MRAMLQTLAPDTVFEYPVNSLNKYKKGTTITRDEIRCSPFLGGQFQTHANLEVWIPKDTEVWIDRDLK